MSQVSGAFTVEIQLERLAERVAERVVALLQQQPPVRTAPDRPQPTAANTEVDEEVLS